MKISDSEKTELQAAKNILENPGLAARITNYIGAPIEKGMSLLPDNWNKNIGEITQTALMKASDAAIFTMKDLPGEASSNIWHKLGVAVSGGIGGFFGIAAVAAELPITTSIIIRSIADIARSQGESVSLNSTKIACLEVFALGGKTKMDDGSEGGYYAVRTALANAVANAAKFAAEKTLTEEGAPILIKLITQIAQRFSIQVTEKVAAQSIPIIGAAGGAIINTIFIDHFQDMARGHFIVRKLERKYGEKYIEDVYATLPMLGD